MPHKHQGNCVWRKLFPGTVWNIEKRLVLGIKEIWVRILTNYMLHNLGLRSLSLIIELWKTRAIKHNEKIWVITDFYICKGFQSVHIAVGQIWNYHTSGCENLTDFSNSVNLMPSPHLSVVEKFILVLALVPCGWARSSIAKRKLINNVQN